MDNRERAERIQAVLREKKLDLLVLLLRLQNLTHMRRSTYTRTACRGY